MKRIELLEQITIGTLIYASPEYNSKDETMHYVLESSDVEGEVWLYDKSNDGMTKYCNIDALKEQIANTGGFSNSKGEHLMFTGISTDINEIAMLQVLFPEGRMEK